MSKNKKQSSQVKLSRRHSMNLPEVVNMDNLAILSDEDLTNRLHALEIDHQKVLDAFQDARPWEEEIAYVRREMQIRKVRKDFHENYLKSSPKSEDDYQSNDTLFQAVEAN